MLKPLGFQNRLKLHRIAQNEVVEPEPPQVAPQVCSSQTAQIQPLWKKSLSTRGLAQDHGK